MHILFWLIATYLLLVLQTMFGPALALGPFTPNLFAALFVPCCARWNTSSRIWSAAGWGFCVDLLGSGPLGINLIAFVLLAAAINHNYPRGMVSSLRIILYAFVAIAGLTAVEMIAARPFEQLQNHSRELAMLWLGCSLYSLMIAVVWTLLLDFLPLRGKSGKLRSAVQ